MKQGSITIKDIARALNISHSTVARALKGSYKIGRETTERVKEYAEKNGYRPNLTAQSLRNQNSRTIGVLLSAIPNNFFAEVLNGIESVASSKDYFVLISQSHELYENEIKNLKHLESRLIDGLLVSLSAETKNIAHFKKLQNNGIPIVFFDRVAEEMETHKVVSDNVGGAFDLTVNLIRNGYKKIGHITSSPEISITKERLQGYKKALLENGFEYAERYVQYCNHGGKDRKEIEDAMDQLFTLNDPPDAIVTASDRITLACLSLLTKRGLRIPQDVGIGGFSNFSAPELLNPSLTTVTQSSFEMGKLSAELLIRLIESKKPVKEFERIVLPTSLTIRNSSVRKS